MFLSKKSVLKSLLVVGLLGMPQRAQADVLAFALTAPIALFLCGFTFLDRKTSASNLVQYQSDISHYQTDVWIDRKTETTVTFTANNPDEILHKTMDYVRTYENQKCKIRIKPTITLTTGKVIALKNIGMRATRIDRIQDTLIQRLFVSSNFHLTYGPRLIINAILWPISTLLGNTFLVI